MNMFEQVSRFERDFYKGYLAALLWSTTADTSDDSDGDSILDLINQGELSDDRSLYSQELIESIIYVCNRFTSEVKDRMISEGFIKDDSEFSLDEVLTELQATITECCELEYGGHTFCLDSHGGGVGFWDGSYDLGSEITQILCDVSTSIGGIDAYLHEGVVYAHKAAPTKQLTA